jgi:hypothetical protein
VSEKLIIFLLTVKGSYSGEAEEPASDDERRRRVRVDTETL